MRRPPSCLSRGKFTLFVALALYNLGGQATTPAVAAALNVSGPARMEQISRARRSLVRGDVVWVDGPRWGLTAQGAQWAEMLWRRAQRPQRRVRDEDTDWDRAEKRFAQAMGVQRYTDIPAHLIRPLPLWRPSTLFVRRSLTGSAAGLCAESRVGTGEAQ